MRQGLANTLTSKFHQANSHFTMSLSRLKKINIYIYICIIYIHICSYNSKHATSPPLPGFSLQPHFPSTQQKFDRMPEVIHPSPSLRWYLITLRLADFLRFLLYRVCFGDHKTLKISINSVPSHLLRVSLIKMGRGNLLQLLSTINMSTCQSTSSGWKLEMHIWFFEWIFNSLGFKIGPKMGKKHRKTPSKIITLKITSG